METTNNFMRGDWIHCSADKYREAFDAKVSEIYSNSIFTEEAEFEGEEIHITEISPIGLTPAILEKNGFTKELDSDHIHYRYSIVHEGIGFSMLYARSVFQWLGPLDIQYVHELQHVFKLAHINKEIVL